VIGDFDLYPWLKVVHILLAIVAVGFNMSYGILLGRAAREPEHLGHVLRTVKVLDDRFANPAYALLFVFGVILVLIGPWEFTDLWILLAIGLYVVVLVMGVAVYSPLLRSQIAVLDADGPASVEFLQLSARARTVGIGLGVIVAVIIGLMVLKPTL
jgi:uncharacterized membrane protein